MNNKLNNFTTSIRDHWLKYLIILNVIFIIISVFLLLITPPRSNITDGENPIIGKKFINSNNTHRVISTIDTPGGTEYQLKSDFPTRPDIIITNEEDEVIFVKESLTPGSGVKVDTYIEKYGEPDLILFAPTISESVRAHVFLDEGLVLIAHLKGNIEQVWSFTPTTEERFLETWGENLSAEPSGPEEAFIQPTATNEADIENESNAL